MMNEVHEGQYVNAVIKNNDETETILCKVECIQGNVVKVSDGQHLYDVKLKDLKPVVFTSESKIDAVNSVKTNDPVNHPSHYTDGKIEVIDFINDKKLNFNRGNVIKYVSRAGKKASKALDMRKKEIQDLEKALFYLNDEIKRLKLELKEIEG